jgi:2-C-methyl-D-erythritol 4-phosphate cytidylyltransferase
MRTWAIVVGAGGGVRFGAPKQFLRLAGISVLDRAVAVARASCDGVVVVLPSETEWSAPPEVRTATGGATRSDSVRSGLACVPDEAEIVIVHDAARPLASRQLFAAVVRAIEEGADAAVPALPVVDTIKRVRDHAVVETVPRDGLVIVQTPQAFRARVLREAHAAESTGTDDAALVEATGGRVVIVDGERRNLKLTLADDLELAQALLDAGTRL